MGNLANSKDPDEMKYNAAFHQGLHWQNKYKLQSLNIVFSQQTAVRIQYSETEIYIYLEMPTCNPL